ncbi:tetratricopeptide repeat protein [Tahibacter amnicola]|uniref:Tetratricopeptide repeat protein n=1 Tax=Tahibacter amnicola TaxID=2976241 RepID=A0ABY6B719_9GAMM|nr:tetratricopeptide repeat protein [Tahibacter amnicola]UXI65898.1 tetratricopeptide repeat protein [Tahibacter amnicola]
MMKPEPSTHPYGVPDVERLLRLPRSTLRALIAAGFVTPARGPRNAYLFSFQDLIVLRTAQALSNAKVPQRRIMRALKLLRARLPDHLPLSQLSLQALADHVVVREGGARWHAESGQYVFSFEGEAAPVAVHTLQSPAMRSADAAIIADTSYAEGIALEEGATDAAERAYRRAIAADPTRLDARINLGHLLHANGRTEEAEATYRDALSACGNEATLLYNLAVLLDDLGRKPEAMRTYEAALREDAQLADGHYNLALLYEELGQPTRALRHMAHYRRLVQGAE